MRHFIWLLLLAGSSAYAQQQIYCNKAAAIPCNTTSQVGVGTQGDPAWLAFGKVNTILAPTLLSASEIACSAVIVNPGYVSGHILRYGSNTTPGTTDMTAALQTAVNCNNHVYIPAGTYKIGAVTLPQTQYLVIYGDGPDTQLVQQANGSPLLSWNIATCCFSTRGYIRDLAFVGTAGTANTLSIVGTNSTTLQNLMFLDVPASHDAIFVNGSNSTYMHDFRASNIQIINSGTSGANAGIELGALVSDSSIERFQMNGNFQVAYCLEGDSGALTSRLTNSHPYNCSTNIVNLVGGNNDWGFTDDVLDNASGGDNVSVSTGNRIRFANVFFENINAGHSGLTLASSSNILATNTSWSVNSGTANATITETGSSNNNTFNQLVATGAYTAPAALAGAQSAWRQSGTDFNLGGIAYSLAGSATQYVGNGQGSTNEPQAEVPVHNSGVIRGIHIAVDNAPGAGQTFTATVRVQGSNASPSCTAIISGASSFSADTGCFTPISNNFGVDTQVVASSGATTANVRVNVVINQ